MLDVTDETAGGLPYLPCVTFAVAQSGLCHTPASTVDVVEFVTPSAADFHCSYLPRRSVGHAGRGCVLEHVAATGEAGSIVFTNRQTAGCSHYVCPSAVWLKY